MTDDFLQRIAKLPPDRLALLAAELKERLDRAEQRVLKGRSSIAIVGMGCRFPGGADDPGRYWDLLRNSVDAVTDVPGERWDPEQLHVEDPDVPGKIVTRRGGFLENLEGFDARFFGIAPREAVSLDPQHRLMLEVTWEALEDAGLAPDRMGGGNGGVFVGLCGHEYLELMLERPLESVDGYYASGGAGSMAAGRISYLLGLQGPALTVDTACSSSLVALHLACESLRNEECDLAISGGVNVLLGVETMIALSRAHMLSPSGRCATFDESADGIVRGEGCGVVVLKRMSDALADGDRIHAVIRATAINQDGRSSGITAPNGTAQVSVMRQALSRAGLAGKDIDFVEAHGTGTRLGDPIEVRALGSVYGERSPERPLRIGSVKTNFGHLEAAAGVAGLIKAVLALKHRVIPPHLHLSRPNPLIEWDRWPLEIPTDPVDWEACSEDGVRRGAVSSFGFSGTNAHAILEEAPPEQPGQGDDGRPYLLSISAKSEAALRTLSTRYVEVLADQPADARSFAEVCHTAAIGRARAAHRVSVVATTREEAAEHLRGWLEGRPGPAVLSGRAGAVPEPVFLFTGQGAQHTDMGRELFESDPVFRDAIERCDSGLRSELDVPLIDVLYPPEGSPRRGDGLIDQTAYTQPALFAVEYALSELWRSWGIEPGAVAGHSIGEYVGATVANVLELKDALELVAARGQLMQELPAGGAMAAVMADAATVEEVLSGGIEAEVAGYNSPLNTVITGSQAAVDAALSEFVRRGIETRPLVVSHAFHSGLIEPILERLEKRAAGVRFGRPEVPFFSTLTGKEIDGDALGQPGYWRDQARSPVRFLDALRASRAAGHRVFLEVGPHPVLCGLGKASFAGDDALFLPSLRRGASERPQLLRTLATLHVRGAEPDWRAVMGRENLRRADLPTYPFERTRYWLGWLERGHGARAGVPDPGSPSEPAPIGDEMVWKRDWIELPDAGTVAGDTISSAVIDGIRERLPDLVVDHGGEVYRDLTPRLDALCTGYILAALDELGIDLEQGSELDEASLREGVGILPRHERLWRRIFEILAEDGILEPRPERGWRVLANAGPLERDLDATFETILSDFPECRTEVELTGRCASRLAEVLTGRADAMELLFPGGSLAEAERLYGGTPSSRVFNSLVAEAVGSVADGRPTGTPLRVLEAGAGTGATTSHLMPLLPPERTEYVFTDVSPLFLDRARARFEEFPFVVYDLLDISRDPREQGFTSGSFDVIVASNVLHATPDLRTALSHVRELLAPGGVLVLSEAVRPTRFGDLTVGLTEGWWSFTDTDVRPAYALIASPKWIELLEECGFEDPQAMPEPASEPGGLLAQQAVMLARRPVEVDSGGGERPRWLALVRSGGESERLARALQAAGADLEVLTPPASRGSETPSPDEWTETIGSLSKGHSDVSILHLLSLDEKATDEDGGAEALARQERSAGTALLATQAATRAGGIRLTFVTRAAQAVMGEEVDPTGAPLWGLGRTIAIEHPDLRGRRIDLPSDWEETVPVLAEILTAGGDSGEDEVALRDGRALVPRIVPFVPESTPGTLRFDPRASYIVTGGLAGLGLRVAEWLGERGAGRLVLLGRTAPTPQTNEVLDRIRAGGSEVLVLLGDVGKPATVTEALEVADEDRLRGVFHCAGVTDDATLPHQDWGRFERVMRAKVEGSWNLHRATRDLDLDHFVLFSSAAAFIGSSGQANHAAANAFLGGLAGHRRAMGLSALAIDWGAWSEIGAATRGDAIERAGAAGIGVIEPADGMRVLEDLLLEGSEHVAAVVIDWGGFLARHPGLEKRGLFNRVKVGTSGGRSPGDRATDGPQPGDLAQRVLSAPPGNRKAVLFEGLHQEAARALGLADNEDIPPTTPLTELGLDSLMAVELRNALGIRLERALPATLLFNYPTLAELTEHLGAELDGNGGAGEGGDTPTASPTASEVDDLDEEEMAELLEKKLNPSASTDS